MGDESRQSLILKGFVSSPLPTRLIIKSVATFDFRMMFPAPLVSASINNPVLERYNPLLILLPDVCQLSGFSPTFTAAENLGLKNSILMCKIHLALQIAIPLGRILAAIFP